MYDIITKDIESLFNIASGRFNRPFKEIDYFKTYEVEDKGYVIQVNALGVDKEDIKVTYKELENNKLFIRVKGVSKSPFVDETQSIDVSGYVSIDKKYKLKDFNYTCKNGYCYVLISVDKGKKPEADIKEVKEISEDFKW